MNRHNIVTISATAILLTGCAFGGKSEQAAPQEQPAVSAPSSPNLARPPSSNPNEVINSNVTGTVNANDQGLSISDQPSVNSYPNGTATPAQNSTIIEGTDGKLYSADDKKTDEDYQSDVASCHYYAKGLVAHDARVEDDRGGSFGDSLGGGRSSILTLRQNIDSTEVKKNQAKHFSRCMKSKGYYQR
ncbi:hypothetical protein [Kiloniella antarctica]|uniref:Lipoprotein n=1 Tax=Kiloniella antarctica TaxID=1550907 RepID=A0ABW5BPZ0_9PROT